MNDLIKTLCSDAESNNKFASNKTKIHKKNQATSCTSSRIFSKPSLLMGVSANFLAITAIVFTPSVYADIDTKTTQTIIQVAEIEQLEEGSQESTTQEAVSGLEGSSELPKLSSLENNPKLTLTMPEIKHFTTDNGVPVAFVRSTNISIVDVNIRFDAGSARDGEVRDSGYGIASMTATMLTQGTKSLNEDDFNRQVEQYGLNLSARANKDSLSVSLRSLSGEEYITPAVDLLSQVLTEATFDTETLERNKARLLVFLKQQQQEPSAIASVIFNQALYGEHPYATPTSGTLTTVPTITQADLKKFHQQFLVASNATIAITGDLTDEQAKNIASQLTAKLDIGRHAKKIADAKPLNEAKYIHIPFDSTQTTIIIGNMGNKPSIEPEEWQNKMNFSIANEALAGANFNARLMTEIRKKRGLTYGIYGSSTTNKSNGSYKISFSTRNEKLTEGIDETIKLVNKTRKEGLSHQEIDLTKNQLSNSFPMSFASNTGINSLLSMMKFYQLPDSYLANYLTRIDNADKAHINQSLKDNIHPDKFLIVTVGDEYDASRLDKLQ